MKKNKNLKVSIVMGSQSDYKTMKLSIKTLKKRMSVVEKLEAGKYGLTKNKIKESSQENSPLCSKKNSFGIFSGKVQKILNSNRKLDFNN